MYKKSLLVFLFIFISVSGWANGNITCPTRPMGDNTNACASTEFVQSNINTISVKAFGAKGDGVTDDTAAIQAALNYLHDQGASALVFPFGTYVFSSQLTFEHPDTSWSIYGISATLKPTAAITTSALKISLASRPTFGEIYGFLFDLRNNTTLSYGIESSGTQNLRIHDNSFLLDNSIGFKANFAVIAMLESTDGDSSTGSFWGRITNNYFGHQSSGLQPDAAILLKGAANATIVSGNVISDGAYGVKMMPSASDVLPNSVVITGNAFEQHAASTVAIAAFQNGSGGTYWPMGLVISMNRVETTNVFFKLNLLNGTGAADQSAPPVLFGNTLIPDVGTYFDNPESALYSSYDNAYFGPTQDNNQEIVQSNKSILFSNSAKNLVVSTVAGSSSYSGGHIVVGNNHIWPDGNGRLWYTAAGAPANSKDGFPMGIYATTTYAALAAFLPLPDGTTAICTDCNSTTFHAAAAGGGANRVIVKVVGGAWLIGG